MKLPSIATVTTEIQLSLGATNLLLTVFDIMDPLSQQSSWNCDIQLNELRHLYGTATAMGKGELIITRNCEPIIDKEKVSEEKETFYDVC